MPEQISHIYTKMTTDRSPYENRAEQYADWTIPYIFPRSGYGGEISLDTDWESIGAQALNNLTNKIMMALFSPSRPFFKMEGQGSAIADIAEEHGVTQADVENMLSRAEREVMRNLARKGMRNALFIVTRYLLVSGNCLLYNPPGNQKPIVYSLRNYVVKRAKDGTVIRIIIKEYHEFGRFSQEEQEGIQEVTRTTYKDDDKVSLYTDIQLNGDDYEINQYAEDYLLTKSKDSKVKMERDKLRYIPLTWNLHSGFDYGHGHVEEYSGELNTIQAMSQCLAEAGAIMSEFKNLVNPNGVADVEELNNSPNGAYVWGLPDDISVPNQNKSLDLQFVSGLKDSAEQRLGRGFLMNSAVTRNAERVTAEEIRQQAQELETSLGGVYTHLSEELQTNLALQELDDIDLADIKDIDPIIITGLDALSRGSEHEQYMLFLNDLGMLNNIPEDVRAIMKLRGALTTMATGRGVEYENSIKTEEEIEQDQRRMQQQQQEGIAQQAAADQMSKGDK